MKVRYIMDVILSNWDGKSLNLDVYNNALNVFHSIGNNNIFYQYRSLAGVKHLQLVDIGIPEIAFHHVTVGLDGIKVGYLIRSTYKTVIDPQYCLFIEKGYSVNSSTTLSRYASIQELTFYKGSGGVFLTKLESNLITELLSK